MLQIIVGLLSIYIGLSISLERLLRNLFKYTDSYLTQENGKFLGRMLRIFSKYASIVGIVGFVIGVIILIAPTPTSEVVAVPVPHIEEQTQRFIGDLFPALCLIIGGLVLNTNIVNFFRFSDSGRVHKIMDFFNQYSFWIGVLAIIFGFIHLIFGSSTLL